jgi:hypothetical protein
MLTETLTIGKDPFVETLVRFLIDLVALFILVRIIYFRFAQKKEFSFVLFLMGIMIFLMCLLLQHADISMGAGFGLFALFSVLRFRTRNLDFRPMAYLFTAIGISAINALGAFYDPVRGPILINGIILLSVYILEVSMPKELKSKKENNGTGDQ